MDINDVNVSAPCYTIPTELSRESIDALLLESETWDQELVEATLNDKALATTKRKSKVSWLPTDHWVAGMMAHLVHSANDNHFGADLAQWADRIQYTVYDNSGDLYTWHIDTYRSILSPAHIRKLSISLLLSDPEEYEGGELQFHRLNALETHKPPIGTAIIFSSQTPHRVRPVKSGVRKSLVGWFGGPPWR